MLYDQALLTMTYSEYFLDSKDPLARHVVEGILNYLETEMRLDSGAWAAAQDADSEGVEGKFFVWTREEILELLGSESAERFCQRYDVSAQGNWEGVNVLRLSLDASVETWSDPELLAMRHLLENHRSLRPRPLRDDKVLVSWNAWMSSALFQAAYAFSFSDSSFSSRLAEAALKTLRFLLEKAPQPEDLAHIYYGEEGFGEALLEDHAALLEALHWAAFCSPIAVDSEWDEAHFTFEARRRLDWLSKTSATTRAASGLDAGTHKVSPLPGASCRTKMAQPPPLIRPIWAFLRAICFSNHAPRRSRGFGTISRWGMRSTSETP
jgi:hypothetical protein